MKTKVCDICNRPVQTAEIWRGDHDRINAAVVGEYRELEGHKTCLRAVDTKVIIPNRLRISQHSRGV